MFSGKRPQHIIVSDYYLAPCTTNPNCVSSLAPKESRQYIDAFQFTDDPQDDLKILKSVLASMTGIGVITRQSNYIHAECRSRVFGFVDDLEFYWDDNDKLCHVRSAARLGFYDFGVNRKRVEKIRAEFMRRRIKV
jgi:uncharacterized protein (DUF1499 family)